MSDQEIYGGARFVPEVEDRGNGMTTAKLAELLREPGLDQKFLVSRVRHFAQKGHINPYARLSAKKDKRQPYLYGASQLLVCAILGHISEAGFSGEDIFRAASNSLNQWNIEDKKRVMDPEDCPALLIIAQAFRGNGGWVFELATFRHREHGRREVRARVRNLSFKVPITDYHVAEGYVQRSLFLIDLDTLLERLFSEKEQVN